MSMFPRALGLMASAAVLALAAGAASAETIRWARVADALTLDPHSQNEGPTSTLLHHIYETLVDRGTDGALRPRLATEWYIHPEDPTIWVLKLREGVTFHDGSDFTAEDVVFSFERVRHASSGFRALHAAVTGATAVDDYTVHVQMAGPAPLYVQNLTNFFIVDSGWATANGVEAPQNYAAGEENYAVRNTNGTGPYTLVSRDPEVRTVLRAFDGHWADETPAVTEIVYTPIAEAATRIAALLSGEVDIVQDVPVQDIARLETTDGIEVVTGPENRNIFFAYDMSSPRLASADVDDNPFTHPEVREAMALAIDRDAIRQVVMRGQSQPSAAPLPPFVNGWREDLHAYSAPDYARAQELVRSVYPNGFSVDLHCPNDRYLNDEAICQALVGMLGRADIRVNLVSQTRSLHFPLIENWQTDFYLLGWGVPPFDSAYVFDFLVHTREGAYGSYNGSRYSNPELDAQIESLATMTDLEARDALVAQIWDTIMADRVFLNVHNQVLAYAVRQGVNIEVHPENQPSMADVTFN